MRLRTRGSLWPPRDVAWAALLAIAVAAAGIHGLWFQAALPGRLPSPTDWKSAASVLSREARPGDGVMLAPAWAERAREAFPGRLPFLPDIEDLTGIRRVWLLSLPDAPGGVGRFPAQLAARSASIERPLRLGELELTRHDLAAPALPLWSLTDRLAESEVDAGGATVAREVREVAFLPRTCVLARWPGPVSGPAVIRLPPGPVGSSLRLRAALVGDTSTGGGSASARLRVDGLEVARADAAPGRVSWAPSTFDATRLPPAAREVTVEIVPDGILSRGVCVELVALP